MNKYTKMAWLNIWRNWRRTLIASTAIVLGLILLIFMDALIQGSDQAIFGNAVRLYGGNIQIHATGFRDRASRLPLLPLDDTERIVEVARAQEKVVAVNKRINTGGLVSSRQASHPVVITAIEPEGEAPVSLIAENISYGRFLLSDDGDAIVIGQELATHLGVTVGDRVTLLGQRRDQSLRQHALTIVGIYDLGLGDAEKGSVFINLTLAQTLYNLRNQETEVAIILEEVGQEDQVIAELAPALSGYEVDSFMTLRPEIQQILSTKTVFVNVFGFIVLLIASIGILNLMLMATFERTREMGVLAALGMKGREIMMLFLLEGMFIGAIGAAVGCFLSWILILIVAQVGIDYSIAQGMGDITALMGTRLYPHITPLEISYYGILVIFIAALASFYPAWQASRREPADALHHV